MKTPVTTLEIITPAMAEKYLSKNVHNRNLRERYAQSIANEITAGRWEFTHQGIAFDVNGDLVDGQHRLTAIILAGIAVKMNVTRGITPEAMDVFDTGARRSVGDQLHLRHGVKNAALVQSCVVMIAALWGHANARFTVGSSLAILHIYGEEIDKLIALRGGSKTFISSPVVAAIAMAMKVDAKVALEFFESVVTGENIRRGMPAYTLREHLRARLEAPLVSQDRVHLAKVTAISFYNAINGKQTTHTKGGEGGIDFLRKKQWSLGEKVRIAISGK